MPHITLSIPEEVYREMKRHPEVRWSEIARQSITSYAKLLKKSVHAREIQETLAPEIREALARMSETRAREIYKRGVREEWKHLQRSSSTRA